MVTFIAIGGYDRDDRKIAVAEKDTHLVAYGCFFLGLSIFIKEI